MKKRIDFSKLILVMVVVCVLLSVFAACGTNDAPNGGNQTPSGGNNQPNNGPKDDDVISSTQSINNGLAMQMIFDSIAKSKEQGYIGSKYMNFSMSSFLFLEHENTAKYIYLDVKAALDIENEKNSKFRFDVRLVDENGAEKILMSFYKIDGYFYIDTRNIAGSVGSADGVHVFKSDDMDLEWCASTAQKLFDELDLAGFLKQDGFGELIGGLLGDVPSAIKGMISGILGNSVLETIKKLAGLDMSTAQLTTTETGEQHLYVPLGQLNSLLPTVMGIVPGLLGDTLADVGDLLELAFGWDLDAILKAVSGDVQMGLAVNAIIKDDLFKSMDFGIELKDNRSNVSEDDAPYNDLTARLGACDFNLGVEPDFDMPDFSVTDTIDYSLTTINADIDLQINAKEHTYTVGTLDAGLGNLISGLIGKDFTLSDTSFGDLPINVDRTVFRLHVKLRLELDLKDNSRTNGIVEIYGAEDEKLRAGLYYVGADETLYVDLSGMGSGRYKMNNYIKTTTKTVAVQDPEGDVVLDGDYYVQYDATKHAGWTRYKLQTVKTSATTSLNLNVMIKDALDKLITEKVPSISRLISGYVAKADAVTSSAEGEDSIYDEAKGLIESGDVKIFHYFTADGATASSTTSKNSVDVFALLKQILARIEIEKGDGKYTLASLTLDLSGEVFDTIMAMVKPGLSLPVTKAMVSYVPDLTTWGSAALTVDLALGNDTDGDLFGLTLPISFTYGRHLDDWEMPNFNDYSKPYSAITVDSLSDSLGFDTVSLALNGGFRLQLGKSSMELTDLQQLLYGILLKLDVENNVDLNYTFSIQANLNINTISTDLWHSLDAKVQITKASNGRSLDIFLSDGMLYVDASAIGIPKLKLDLAGLVKGDVKVNLFGKASATADGDTTGGDTGENKGMSTEQILGIVAAVISGVNIDSSAIEVSLASDLIGALVTALAGTDNEVVNNLKPFLSSFEVTEGSGLKISLDGLNLSELYIDVNLGVKKEEFNLDLGLGLGHILVGLEALDLAPTNPDSYEDVLSNMKFYLALTLEVGLEMSESEINLSTVAGGLLGDLLVGLNVEEDINPGLILNLQANLDLGNAPQDNETELLLTVTGRQTGKTLIGVYYSSGALYADVPLLGIEKFYIDLDLIELLSGLINKKSDEQQPDPAPGSAMATEGGAGDGNTQGDSSGGIADILGKMDLSDVVLGLALGDEGIKVEVATGITGALLSYLAGAIEGSVAGGQLDAATAALVKALRTNSPVHYTDENGEDRVKNISFPEIGAEVSIDWGREDGVPFLNALELGVQISLKDGEKTVLGIDLGIYGLQIGFKARKFIDSVALEEFEHIDLLTIGDTVQFNLDVVHFDISGYFHVSADENSASDNKTELKDILANFYKYDENGNLTQEQTNSILRALSDIILKCEVLTDLEQDYGIRLAGNISLGSLISGGKLDIKELLQNSEIAVEIYYGRVAMGNDPIIGLYLQNGMLYIRLNGTIADNVKLKFNLLGSGLLDGLIKPKPDDPSNPDDPTKPGDPSNPDGPAGSAVASAIDASTFPLIPANILDLLNGALSGIGISREAISIGIGAKLIDAVVTLILGKEVKGMPELNEAESRLWLGFDEGISLNLRLKIDPICFGLTVDNINLGLKAGSVIPAIEEEAFETEYVSLADLSTVSLSLEAGVDIVLKESKLNVDDIVSAFVSDLTTGLGVNFEDDHTTSIGLSLKGNLDFSNALATEVSLEISLLKDTGNELLVGVYIDGSDVYAQFPGLNISAFKVTDIEAIEKLLNDVYAKISGILKKLDKNAADGNAVATADDDATMDLIFALSKNTVKIELSTALISGILGMLPSFGVKIEDNLVKGIQGIVESLDAGASVSINLHDVVLRVDVDTNCLGLGVWLGYPMIGTSFIEGVLAPVESNPDIFVDFNEEGNVYVELELAIRYRLTETDTELNGLLGDLLGDVKIGDISLTTLLNKLLVRLCLTNDAMGQIGLKIMVNANVKDILANKDNLNINTILESLDLALEISLGSKKVYVALIDYVGEDGIASKYIFLKLDEIGVQNMKISLDMLKGIIGGIGKDKGEGAALSTDGDTEEPAPSGKVDTKALLNKLLNLDGNYIGVGERGLEIRLAYNVIAVLLSELLTGFDFSEGSLDVVNLVNEKTDDTAFMLCSEAKPEDIMDNRPYVKVDGEYVLYDAGDSRHDGLEQYYKIRTTAITLKTNDPKNSGKVSVNVDIALALGLDIGLSIYGYKVGFTSNNMNLPLGDTGDYSDVANIMQDKITVSLDAYVDLSLLDDADYNASPLIKTVLDLVKADGVDGLADLLYVISLKTGNNRLNISVGAAFTINDIINMVKGGKIDLTNFDISLEIFDYDALGNRIVYIGLYLYEGNGYVDMYNYNGSPVLYIENAASALGDIIGGIGKDKGEGAALATDGGAGELSAEEIGMKLAVDVVLGSAGLGVLVHTGLVETLLELLLPDMDLHLVEIFGNVGAKVMIDWEDAKGLGDLGIDVAVTLGALQIGLGIGNIGLAINPENGVVPETVVGEATNVTQIPFNAGFSVQLVIGAENGNFNIGDLLAGILPGLALDLNVPAEDGETLELNLDVEISVNLEDFNTLEAKVELRMAGIGGDVLLLGAYYTRGVVYVDARGLLGEAAKVQLTGLDLGGILEDILGEKLGHNKKSGGEGAAASADDFDVEMAAVQIILDGKAISVRLTSALLDWVLNLDAVKKAITLPDGIDLDAMLSIGYINEETGLFDLSVSLDAVIAEMLRVGLKLHNIEIGFHHNDLVAIEDAYAYVEAADFNMTYDKETKKISVNPEVVMEHVNLQLELDIYSRMIGQNGSDTMDLTKIFQPLFANISDFLAKIMVRDASGNAAELINNLSVKIVADVKLKQLLETVDFSKLDVSALLACINAGIEVYDNGRKIIGIYLSEGSVYLQLDGLGFENIVAEKEFVDKLLDKLLNKDNGAGSAMSSADGEDTMATVVKVINSLIASIDVADKTLSVVIANSYLTELFNLVFPDLGLKAPDFDLGRNAISINLNRGFYTLFDGATAQQLFYAKDDTNGTQVAVYDENGDYVIENYDKTNPAHFGLHRYDFYVYLEGAYVKYDPTNPTHAKLDKYVFVGRNGLIEVDLSFFSSELGIYIPAPTVGVTEYNFDIPEENWQSITDAHGVQIGLTGTIGLNTNNIKGITAGQILGGILGDLDTKVTIDKMDMSLNYDINVYLGFEYDIEAMKFEITALDLSIRLIRDNGEAGKTVQTTIIYDGTAGKAYVDLGFLGLPKLSVDGLKIKDVLALLKKKDDGGGEGSVENALATANGNMEKSATADVFTSLASVIILLKDNFLSVGLSSKFIVAIVQLIAGEEVGKTIAGYLPNLGVELRMELHPFVMGLFIQLQDANCDKVVDLFLTFNGFDFAENGLEGGSTIKIFDKETYSGDLVNIDPSEFSNLLTVNLGADKNLGESVVDLKLGVLSLSAELDLGLVAFEDVKDWAKAFKPLFGIGEEEMKMIIATLEEDSVTDIGIKIEGNVNLGGLLSTPMSFAGTELRITLSLETTSGSSALVGSSIVITLIGEEASGKAGVYIDLSNYRNLGKLKLELDLAGLIGGIGSSTGAVASDGETKNYGLLGESIFNVLNGILGELKFSEGTISINLSENLFGKLFDLLLSSNPNFAGLKYEDMPKVSGGLSIDVFTMTIKVNLIVSETMSVELKLHNIKLGTSPIEEVMDSGSLAPASAADFKDIFKSSVEIQLLGSLGYTLNASGTAAADLSEIFTLIKNKQGVSLLQNPLVQIDITNDVDMHHVANTYVYVDLNDFSKLKVAVEIYKDVADMTNGVGTAIAAYIDGTDIYVDVSALGIPKLRIANVNIAKIIEDALSNTGLFTATDSSPEYDMGQSWGDLLFGDIGNLQAYVALVFAPERFAIGINMSMIDAIIKVVQKSQGQDVDFSERLLPRFGEASLSIDSREYVPVSQVGKNQFSNFDEQYVRTGVVNAEEAHKEYVYTLITSGLDKETAYVTAKYSGGKYYINLNGSAVELDTSVNGLYVKTNGKYKAASGTELGNEATTYYVAKYMKFNDVPRPALTLKLSDDFYGVLQLDDLILSVNDSVLDNLAKHPNYVSTETLFANNVYGEDKGFQTLYDVETGAIGVEKLAIGASLEFTLGTSKGANDTSSAEYSNTLQSYLSLLVGSLLTPGTTDDANNPFDLNEIAELGNYLVTAAASSEISYELVLKVVVDVPSAISDGILSVAGILKSEISVEINITSYGNVKKKVLGLYKVEGDDAVYADLSGLGLPKIKLFGLSDLLGGLEIDIGGMLGSAISTADETQVAEKARISLVLDEGLIEFSLEPEAIYQIMTFAGTKVYDADEYSPYKYIVTQDRNGYFKRIPLPDAQSATVFLNILDKLESVEVNVVGDPYGSNLYLAIKDFTLTTDAENFIQERELPDEGERENYGAIYLASGGAINLANILSGVLDAHDLDIKLGLNHNVSRKYDGNVNAKVGDSTKVRASTIISVRTTGASTQTSSTGGTNLGNNVLLVDLNIYLPKAGSGKEQRNVVDIYLYNNKIGGDLSGVLQGSSSNFIYNMVLSFLKDMEFADLDIIGLISGSGTESEGAAASTEEAAKASAFDFFTGLDIGKLIKGVKLDWWNGYDIDASNAFVGGTSLTNRSDRYSTIEVELDIDFFNKLFADVNYLLDNLVGSFLGGSVLTAEQYAIYDSLTYEQKMTYLKTGSVTDVNGNKINLPDVTIYGFTNGFYSNLITGLGNMIGFNIGSVINLLPTLENNVRGILDALLPFPIFDAGTTAKAVIVLDKGEKNSESMALVSTIALLLGCEPGQTVAANNMGSAAGGTNAGQAFALVIKNGKINVKSARSWDWYNDTEKAIGTNLISSGVTYSVMDAFDPWELNAESLHDSARLPQRVYVTFNDGTNTKHSGSKDLAGTHVVWDSSTVDLTPGATSYMYGYAGNVTVGRVKVEVSTLTAYQSLYGYLNENGEFVRSTKLHIDPLGIAAGSVKSLPETIVTLLNNSTFQVLSTKYDAANLPVVPANIAAKAKYGKLYWKTNVSVLDGLDGDYDGFEFWYSVAGSSRIHEALTVTHYDRTVSEVTLPDEERFNMVVNGTGDVLALTEETYDIVANFESLTTVEVTFTTGEKATLSVEWDLSKLKKSYDKKKAYLGLDSEVVAKVGVKEGLTQKVTIPVHLDKKVFDKITPDSVTGKTPTFSFNPYDEYTGSSISLTDGNMLDVELFVGSAADSATTRVATTLVLPDKDKVDLSYKGTGSFIATVQIGGVFAADGTVLSEPQKANVRVNVLDKTVKNANVQFADGAVWKIAELSHGQAIDITEYVLGTAGVTFEDGTVSTMSVVEVDLKENQTVTNSGGSLKAVVKVRGLMDTDDGNMQTIDTVIMLPRNEVLKVYVDKATYASTGSLLVEYTKGGKKNDYRTEYSVYVPGLAEELADKVSGDEITVDAGIVIGSQTVFSVIVTDSGAGGSAEGESAARRAGTFSIPGETRSADDSITVSGDLEVLEILDADALSIVCDPMEDDAIHYPSAVYLRVRIDGVEQTVLATAEFFSLYSDVTNPVTGLPFSVERVESASGAVYENPQYEGGDFDGALVRFWYGGKSAIVNVPLTVLNRVVVNDDMQAQFTVVNPYEYDSDPFSPTFSLARYVMVTFESGEIKEYPVSWENIDVDVTAAEGKTFTATVTYGKGMGYFKKDITVIIYAYTPTAEKLSEVQSALDEQNFYAYVSEGRPETDPLNVANYPQTATVQIGKTQTVLQLRWDLSGIHYTYEGGTFKVPCKVGKSGYGETDVEFEVNVKPCVVVSSDLEQRLAALSGFAGYKTGLNMFDVGYDAPSISECNVSFEGIGEVTEKVTWDMSQVKKGLNVAAYSEDNTYTFTVYAIIRNKEYAGPQKIPFTFKYYAYEVAEVSKTDGSYSAIFDTETKIDPYNAPFPSFPRTVYVKFKKAGTTETTRYYAFSTTDATYNLVWDKSGYNTKYNSESCKIVAKLSRSGLNFENAFAFEVINKTAVKFKFADSETVYYVKDSVIYTDAACTEKYVLVVDAYGNSSDGIISRIVNVAFSDDPDTFIQYNSTISTQGGYKVTYSGSAENYGLRFEVGGNETLKAEIHVLQRSIDVSAYNTNEEIEAYLKGKIPGLSDGNKTSAVSLPKQITLDLVADEYAGKTHLGTSFKSNKNFTFNLYYKYTKYYYKDDALTDVNVFTKDGLDFNGNVTGEKNVKYLTQILTSETFTTRSDWMTAGLSIGGGSEKCAYVITCYVGRYYEDGSMVVKYQYALTYTLIFNGYAEKQISFDFSGAWRSADLNYNYIVFDANYDYSFRTDGKTQNSNFAFVAATDGRYVVVDGEYQVYDQANAKHQGLQRYKLQAAGKDVTFLSNGNIIYDGTEYCKYDFKTAVKS